MLKARGRRWWSIALRGVVALVFGLLSLIAPGAAFASLVLLFGAFALVDGVLAISVARAATGKPTSAVIGRGIVSILAGIVTLIWPGISALALLIVIGAWAIAAGLLEIAAAYRLRNHIHGEWLLGLEGVLSVVFGGVLLVSPLAGVVVLGIWVGAYALAAGVMLILAAFEARSVSDSEPRPFSAAA